MKLNETWAKKNYEMQYVNNFAYYREQIGTNKSGTNRR